MNKINAIAEDVINGRRLDENEALELISLSEADPFELLHAANRIRRHFKGNRIHLCSIINARSGACSENCAFCAQSIHHTTGVKTYPLLDCNKLADAARQCASTAAGHFGIVTSGRGPGSDGDVDTICGVLSEFAGAGAGVGACASLGSLTPETARKLKAAGLRRYNHNLETARSFFPSICSTHTYDDRLATVKAALDAGLEVCCGGILGLGETWRHRIEMAIELRELGVHNVPINFLNPVRGTRLADMPVLPAMEGLRIIALYRFLLPDRGIKTAGGRELCLGDLQSWMFPAGSDSTMIGNYLTPAGRPADEDLKMIEALGLEVSKEESGTGFQPVS